MALWSSRPLVVVVLAPQYVFFCVVVASCNKAVSQSLEELFVFCGFYVVFGRAIDCRDSYFSHLILQDNASCLNMFFTLSRTEMVFEVPSDDRCSTTMCFLVRMWCVIYRIMWYVYMTSIGDMCF